MKSVKRREWRRIQKDGSKCSYVRRLSNQFPAHERPPLEESGSAVQKVMPQPCPSRSGDYLKSNLSFDTLTWNMRRLKNLAAAVKTS